MTEAIKSILKKMKDPTYGELNFEFMFKLTNESDRGAILIGTSKVEEYLKRIILAVLPSKSRQYTSRLLNYPGPLSSFSAKIELCYAFRVIGTEVYDALNILRKIRNSAAHSDTEFSLTSIAFELNKVYSFEYGFDHVVHELSWINLIKWKKKIVARGLAEQGDVEELWEKHIPEPEKDERLLEQLEIWKLAHGLCMLCLKMDVIADEYNAT
jgi:hypothetical protein